MSSASIIRRSVPARRCRFGLAMTEGVKTALLTILVYLIALPFVFFAGVGFIAFFIATAWLLGREYFELAAMRFRTPAEAKAMRQAQRRHHLHRRADHRGVRVDPDRQSGDAAVRHGLHGPHAQAAFRPAAGTDRAGAERRACRWCELFSLAPLLRGEGWGEGLSPRILRMRYGRYPLTRIAKGAPTSPRKRGEVKSLTPSSPASGRDR